MSSVNKESALALIQSIASPDDIQDLESYLPYLQEYATDSQSRLPNDQQFSASLLWVLAAREHNHESLLSAYRHLISLFDHLAILGFDLWARKQVLDRLPHDLAIAAARCAIEHKDLELAITLLDKSRGLTWQQVLRTLPQEGLIDELAETQPDLGIPLRGYLRALHISNLSNRAKSKAAKELTRHEIDDHVAIAQYVDQLLAQVRALPGYGDFMLPDPLKSARALAELAPLVVLIPDETSTHLILIRSRSATLEHRTIDGLNSNTVQAMAQKIRRILQRGGRSARGDEEKIVNDEQALEYNSDDDQERGVAVGGRRTVEETTQHQLNEILTTLWRTIGITIKDMLELKRNPVLAPKVYLYPTGSLTHLPIHAAGEHGRPHGEALLDYIAPSYVTSLQNLIFPQSPPIQSPLRVLVISQPNTPNHNPLPAADQEVAIIRKYAPPEQLVLAERQEGNRQSLISGPWMQSRENPLVLHLACHAHQNTTDPLASGFFLHDGDMKISQLISQRNKHPFLAVLSACETAAGDEERPDETLHIGAALNCLQGFQSVIATLWAMRDEDGPKLAEVLYSDLFSTEDGGRVDPATSLRRAINLMRAEKLPFVRWVPFVHFGF
ncbi:hypothetical protein BDV93DRAFT_603102 [Ceratobasidium sp. AG-I]|nr:hypothetical protein BDV93DRAFT_603102 [Ceratobasidium sp. AG-I]